MLINLRNALMAGKRLPYDAEVEYLESTGTQWIVTDTPGESGMTLGCEFSWPSIDTANGNLVFGIYESSTTEFIPIWRVGKTKYALSYGYGVYNEIKVSFAPNTRTTVTAFFDVGVQRVELNGAVIATGNSNYRHTISTPLSLFATFSGESLVVSGTRVYHAFARVGNDMKMDFIPVRKGNVGYMYDRVSGKLFGNAGTGDFVLGPDVVPVEYIQGQEVAYIDTGVVPTMETEVEVTVMPRSTPPLGPMFIFGCRMATGNNTYACLLNTHSRIGYRVGNDAFVYTSGYSDGGAIHKYGIANGVFYRDGAVVSDACIGASFNVGDNTLALLAINTSGTYGQILRGCRLYSCAINNSSTPVRSFRPVRVGTDATSWEGAMMDVLTRRIYRNAGTGAFTYGNDLKYPIPAE